MTEATGEGESAKQATPADRAFAKLSEAERRRVRPLAAARRSELGLPFSTLQKAYERMLYALDEADTALSPIELVFLLAARWSSNTDGWSVQRRIALALQQEEVTLVGGGRYRLTEQGREHLRQIEREWLRRDEGSRRRRSGPRGPRRRDARR